VLHHGALVRGTPSEVNDSVELQAVATADGYYRLLCGTALLKIDAYGQLVLGHARPFETDSAWPVDYHFHFWSDAAAPL